MEFSNEVLQYKADFEAIVKKCLPKFYTKVSAVKTCFGTDSIYIQLAIDDTQINNVKGQYVQHCVLWLYFKDMTLEPAHIGGSGGSSILIKPQVNKNLYCERVKVPFRKPQPKKEAILKAVEKWCINYKKVLQENKDILMYHDLVNYDLVLND